MANAAYWLADRISRPDPPPPGGFRNSLPEAFAALGHAGSVIAIGYQGEWYTPLQPTLRVRLHNWLLRVGAARSSKEACDG